MFTGDTLFIGDVGRPDLIGSKGFTAEQMGELLYDSLHNKRGSRSKKSAQMLVDAGFPQAISITGGTTKWRDDGLPMEKDLCMI